MIIDSHCHVIASDTARYPHAPLFGKQSEWSAGHSLDHPDMVKANVEADVDKAILVQASSVYGFCSGLTAGLSSLQSPPKWTQFCPGGSHALTLPEVRP